MISNKQRTIALSTVAIATVIVLFASGPLVATHQAWAWGHRHGHGGFGFPGWGGSSCGCCGCGGLGLRRAGAGWGGGGLGRAFPIQPFG